MARCEHLPIWKKAMDLTIYFEKVVRNFSRYIKSIVGSEAAAFLSLVVILFLSSRNHQLSVQFKYEHL